MAGRKPKSKLTWTDVKRKLAGLGPAGLLGLIQDLYAVNKDNQIFLHARLGLGEDVLKPYKDKINRWIWPDVFLKQDISVSKGKQAISDYRKAVGEPAGLAELMVFYCERAAGFANDIVMDDEGYLNSLVSMFAQAIQIANRLPDRDRAGLVSRLDHVRSICENIGYGVGDAIGDLFARFASE